MDLTQMIEEIIDKRLNAILKLSNELGVGVEIVNTESKPTTKKATAKKATTKKSPVKINRINKYTEFIDGEMMSSEITEENIDYDSELKRLIHRVRDIYVNKIYLCDRKGRKHQSYIRVTDVFDSYEFKSNRDISFKIGIGNTNRHHALFIFGYNKIFSKYFEVNDKLTRIVVKKEYQDYKVLNEALRVDLGISASIIRI